MKNLKIWAKAPRLVKKVKGKAEALNRNELFKKYYSAPLKENWVLLEAGQGKNTSGNMFAFLRELRTDPVWADYEVYWAVTEETLPAMKARLAFYGYENVHLTLRMSDEYIRVLCTARYLLTDNSFPIQFTKRADQVYLNTWHGTPLKTLGICNIQESTSIANVQKNYFMSDYALFQNDYTADVFMDDYSLGNLMQGKLLMCDYPRNDVFLRPDTAAAVRKAFDLEGKRLYAYLPTWRGTGRKANIAMQVKETLRHLKKFDKALGEDEILYVNLHFLIGNNLDLTTFKHVRPFPQEYETYDFLSACDALITDYSSVFFDFAVTGRPIVLFTYDLEEYLSTRATYFPVEDLPFPRAETADGVISLLRDPAPAPYPEFQARYCPFAAPDTTKRVLQLLTEGKSDSLILRDAPYNGKENVLVHIRQIRSLVQLEAALTYLKGLDEEHNYILFFEGQITQKNAMLVSSLPKNIQVFAYVRGDVFGWTDYLKNRLSVATHTTRINDSLVREGRRLVGNARIHAIRVFLDTSYYKPWIFYSLPVRKEYVRLPEYLYGYPALKSSCKYAQDYLASHADSVSELEFTPGNETISDTYYSACFSLKLRAASMKLSGDNLLLTLRFKQKNVLPEDIDSLEVHVGKTFTQVVPQRIAKMSSGGIGFTIAIPVKDLLVFPFTNRIQIIGRIGEHGFTSQPKIVRRHFSRRIVSPNSATSVYFDPVGGRKKFFNLMVREKNVSDSLTMRIKVELAWRLSNILPKKDVILMYEKKSARYEESASLLYEKLLDEGYTNVHYILDSASEDWKLVPAAYRKNLVKKFSFRHCWYFFSCRKFIGTEMLSHSFEVRCIHPQITRKMTEQDLTYVFLQHGVMYMISLDAESRSFFRKSQMHDRYYVVTSSQLEADHFVQLGGYMPDQLLITGLPKFDRNRWNPEADKIAIMPTWRDWEYNAARLDVTSTRYYQMILRIFNAIPEQYRDRVVILPHPLVFDILKASDCPLKPYMQFHVQYNELLQNVKLLITDYSSISYDAFYRGANVIFYWEELDYALSHYGANAKLMINEDTCFGDVCRKPEDVTAVLEKNLTQGQQQKYLDRYSRIVEFHDGHNTERLIAELKKKGVL